MTRSRLHRYNNQEAFAVDDGVMLYLPRGFSCLRIDLTKIVIQRNSLTQDILTNPTEADLLQAGIENYEENVQSYLRSRAKNGAEGIFHTKVGLLRIDYPVDRIGQPLTLHLVPLSYWVLREFNRRILDYPDAEISSLRNESLSKILSTRDSVTFPCPSALYVEVSIVTQDMKLVILEKNRKLSALARKGFSWTCTLEEGLVWAKDINEDYVDFDSVVKRGLGLELNITPDDIDGIEYYGVALEHTHLNSAIVGVMMLNIPSRDLESRIKSSEDFGLGYHFISLDSMFQELFLEVNHQGKSWHPTGRLRALFVLYHLSDATPSVFTDDSLKEAYFSHVFGGQCSTGVTTQLETNEQSDFYRQQVQVDRQEKARLLGVIEKMSEQERSTYDLRGAKFGGGFAAEGGFQVGGNLIDVSSSPNLADAAQQIQDLLKQLEVQGITLEDAQQQVASDLAKQAESNPTVLGKLVQWSKTLADTASKTTVSEAAKGVVKLALQMSGIPLP
jgi:hypothetical protein